MPVAEWETRRPQVPIHYECGSDSRLAYHVECSLVVKHPAVARMTRVRFPPFHPELNKKEIDDG